MTIGRYILRFDDICPSMDWTVFSNIENIIDYYRIRPIVAIVPDNRDPGLMVCDSRPDRLWRKARSWQEKNWIIGLHGYTHLYDTFDSGIMRLNSFSEFAGHPYEVQYERIERALCIFRSQGLHPDIFVAPAHSFDATTLRVLKDLRIHALSDGFSFRATRDSLGICWIPQQLWTPRKMPFGLWTFCIHPNTMTERGLDRLERFLAENRETFVKDIKVLISEAKDANMLDTIASKMIREWHSLHDLLCRGLVAVRRLF
jgi:predicted deacetylase